MCLLWFLKCFLLFGPFVRIHVAIDYMVILCCFVGYLLIDVLRLCCSQRI
jgi:hypothetical protein